MRVKAIYLMAVAALISGCAGESPLASGDAAGPAAKLTISGGKAGGSREPRGTRPGTMPAAPARLAQVRFDQQVEAYGVGLTLLEVRDSRCPQDAVCIWEGEVAVLLGVTVDGTAADPVTLTLRTADDERAQVRLGNRVVRLQEVAPYPRAGVETGRAEYVASVSVGFERPPRPTRPIKDGLTVSATEAGGEAPQL
ncbi:MAG: hypothetical protein WDA75_21880 [Candidatus Latescibacterota bacterium]|jgi:hypothetical protein